MKLMTIVDHKVCIDSISVWGLILEYLQINWSFFKQYECILSPYNLRSEIGSVTSRLIPFGKVYHNKCLFYTHYSTFKYITGGTFSIILP